MRGRTIYGTSDLLTIELSKVNKMKKLFSEIPYIKSERLVLRKIKDTDAEGLAELAQSPNVYRYLPTFLFEQKYEDVHCVIRRLYDECFKESIILGVFM